MSEHSYTENIVVAKPDFCVPAVLQMVLEHYGISNLTQDDIASQMTVVPNSKSVEPINWGVHIDKNTINVFFENNGINLIEKYIPINQIMDGYMFEETIKDLLRKGISIICGYNYSWLFGNRDDTFRHVSIIIEVSSDAEKVLLLDPGPKDAGYKYVSIEDLFYAIKIGKAGIWCISKPD